jgi:hypothetical protein
MELFEMTKAMFESPGTYSGASKGDKRKNFFMIQRRMAIQYPILANMLQRNKINQEAAVDLWQRYLRLNQHYTKTPFWMYTEGVKKAQEKKEKKINISNETVQEYCKFYQQDPKQIRDAIKFYPAEMAKELKEFEKLQLEIR